MPPDRAIDAFADALIDPTLSPPAETKGREEKPDVRRFSVYRNNIAVSLIGAIEARYPVTRRLVGEQFFRGMARSFVERHKPSSPVILHYGSGFPDFVAGFEPARDVPYLPDVARIESAWVEAYHAADDETVGLAALAAADPGALGELKLTFHPAARLLCSRYPAASIWAAHQGEGDVAPPEHWGVEEILITRPDAEVRLRLLPAGGYRFASALREGATLGEAHAAAMHIEGFDPGQHLVGLVEAGAISRIAN